MEKSKNVFVCQECEYGAPKYVNEASKLGFKNIIIPERNGKKIKIL